MIDNLIRFSIQNKLIVLLFTFCLIAWGLFSLSELPIDAVPDITNNQVQVITTSPTLAAQEVEQYITYPIELALATIPEIHEIRSISRFGLSVITIVFKDKVNIYLGRQLVLERISEAEKNIPPGLGSPELAPISTGLGEIYQYVLINKDSGKKYSAMEMRTIQDWIVKRQLLGTPGVAEVSSFGGYVKQYQVSVDPNRLKAMNITITDIFTALESNNSNTGGAYIEKGHNASFIRGLGTIRSLEDIENILIAERSGVPLLIRDVAIVEYGSAVRYGALTRNGEGEVVGGIVLMLKGENTMEVINSVKAKMEVIKRGLPPGLEIEVFLDRSDLIDRTIRTVRNNLLEGGLIVIFVLVLLLGNLRAGLIVASVIPLSMLFAIAMMNIFNVSGNLMSLGAIDFGLIVDGAVIIVEAIVHRISSGNDYAGQTKLNQVQMDDVVYKASARIRKSAAFGEIIILIVYLPILALVGIEGKMFGPMAQTVSFAILGALVLSLTYVPMVSSLVLKKNTLHKKNISDKIMAAISSAYEPILNFALRRRLVIIFSSAALFLVALMLFFSMGGEFMPTLREGDLAIESSISPGSSLSQSVRTFSLAEKLLLKHYPDEVQEVLSKIGSSEIPTDPMPIEAADITVILKDPEEWTRAASYEELVEKMEKTLEVIPGLNMEFSQPIQLRFNELLTGVKQDIAIKIYGEDLDILFRKTNEVASLIRPMAGVGDIKVEQIVGLPQIIVAYKRAKIAQYGLSIENVNNILNTAFAGAKAGVIYEGEKRFELVVRLGEQNRSSLQDVSNLFIPLSNGNQIPLSEVATIKYEEGAMQISRDDTKRRATVGVNARDRDVESLVAEIQDTLKSALDLPSGYYVTYGGQFENLVAAKERLTIVVPISMALIFILLFFTFNSVLQSVLIFTAIPLAAIGGIFSLLLRGMPFSISAGIGFIALSGVAVLNGIVLISYFNQLKKEGVVDLKERIKKGAHERLRPVIMTAAVASFGFLPMALSGSAGAEVQRPLATVVIGGLITSTLLTLIVLPVLYSYIESGKNNMLKNSVIVLSIFLLSSCTESFCQSTPGSFRYLSLSEALKEAFNNNPSILKSALEIEKQKILKSTIYDFSKTSVGFNYGQFDGPSNDNAFLISQQLEFPTVYKAAASLSKETIKSKELAFKAQQNELARAVKLLYLQLMVIRERTALLRFQEYVYRDFGKAAEIRYKTGETAYLEKIAADARLMEIENALSMAKADSLLFLKKLQGLTGIKENFIVTDSLVSFAEVAISDSVLTRRSPYLQFVEQQIEISTAMTNMQKSSMLPSFSLGIVSQTLRGYHQVGNREEYFGPSSRFEYFQGSVGIPILFGASKGRIRSAAIQEKISRAIYENEKLNISLAFQEQLGIYNKQRTTLKYYNEKALPQADLLIEFAQKSYKAGEIGYVELLSNISEAIAIRSNHLENLSNLNQTQIQLEYLSGIQ